MYDYYCDCSSYLCSFENKYNIYNSTQFYINISGFALNTLVCIIFIIGQIIKKCSHYKPIQNELNDCTNV